MRWLVVLALTGLARAEERPPSTRIGALMFPQRGVVNVPVSVTGPCELRLQFSLDSGATWKPAKTAPRTGDVRTWAWDSTVDLAGVAFAGVMVRVVPDGTPARAAPSDSFTIDNDAAAQLVTRYPYLQRAREGAVLLVWKTRHAEETRLEFGPTRAMRHKRSREGLRSTHTVELTGLAPRRTYHYRVLDRAGRPLTAIERFRAPPARDDTRVSFFVVGDTGGGTPTQHRLAATLKPFALRTDFGLHTGDIVYPHGEAALYDERCFQVYRDVLKSVPLFPVIGNHGVRNREVFNTVWHTFRNGPRFYAWNYSFDLGPVHVATLDSGRNGPPWVSLEWLTRDLAASKARFDIVVQHMPVYTTRDWGKHYFKLFVPLGPRLERAGVALNLAGHDHLYARTGPRRDFERESAGTVYVTSGGGGKSLYAHRRPHPYALVHDARYHFLVCEVDGRRLTGRAIDIDGDEFDRFVIER